MSRTVRRLQATIGALLVAGIALTGCTSSAGNSAPAGRSPVNGAAVTTQDQLKTGVVQIGRKQYSGAEATFTAIVQAHPKDSQAWYYLGYTAQATGRATTALADFAKALTYQPTYVAALYGQAQVQEGATPARAVRTYRQILRITPHTANVYYRLGLLYRSLRQTGRAKAAFASAITLDPSFAASVPAAYRA